MFEAKIVNGYKDVAFTRNHKKNLSFKTNLTLKVRSPISKQSETFR